MSSVHAAAKRWFDAYHDRFGRTTGVIGFGFANTAQLQMALAHGAQWLRVNDEPELAKYIRDTWKYKSDFACNPSDQNTILVVIPYQ